MNVIRNESEREPGTMLQHQIYEALRKHPAMPRQGKAARVRLVASICKCHPRTVYNIIKNEEYRAIGEKLRREKEHDATMPVLSDGGRQWGSTELEIVKGFRGWRDAFKPAQNSARGIRLHCEVPRGRLRRIVPWLHARTG